MIVAPPRTLIAVLAVASGLAAVPAAQAATGSIYTIAGSDTAGFADGSPTSAQFHDPFGVTPTADGGYLVADLNNYRVRRISPTGSVTTVAGNGTSGTTGDGGPATSAQLCQPYGVAEAADGAVLIADGCRRIRRVGLDGVISTVAGGADPGPIGDGGPATAAFLSGPASVTATPDGGYLIAEAFGRRVRRVSPAGIISTVAGTGASGTSGDGGPATSAAVSRPFGLSFTPDGGFLIADPVSARVRRVSPSGTISTVAGGGSAAPGDAGPATAASLTEPYGVAATPDNGFLIADGARVRRVSPSGRITTMAGTGTGGSSGDGGPATLTPVAANGVALTPDGGVVITSGQRIRYVDTEYVAPPAAGAPGATGAAGSPGSQGSAGSQGAAGPAGPQGRDGRDARVTCKVAKPKGKKKKSARVTCTVQLAKPARGKVTARLLRHGRVYASGRAAAASGVAHLGLAARKPLARGRYTLRVTVEAGGASSSTSERVTIG